MLCVDCLLMSSVLSLRSRIPFRTADSTAGNGTTARRGGMEAVEDGEELEIIPLDDPVISLSARELRVLGESEDEDGDINHLTIDHGEQNDVEQDDIEDYEGEIRSGCRGRVILTTVLTLVFVATITVAIRGWIQYEVCYSINLLFLHLSLWRAIF